VDITNYVMLEWGQPLHAFDYDKLVERAGGGKPTIIVRRAYEGEHLVTLDGEDRALDPEMLMIADTAGAIAIAGVMGGLETEVTEETRNILLESANFDYINNRRTSQLLKLPSEASHRFSRGIPAEMVTRGVIRASELMRLHANGHIARGLADNYPVKQPTVRVDITPAEVRRQLGMDVGQERIEQILTALDFRVERLSSAAEASEANRFGLRLNGNLPLLRVTVPWHRLDVSYPADLIEEIARVIGYDAIPETLMEDVLPPQRRNWQLEAEERVRDILAGAGLQEVIAYSLVGADENQKLLASLDEPTAGYDDASDGHANPIPCILPPDGLVQLANPLSGERDRMRSTLLGGLLDTLWGNLRHADRMAIFEIGSVYWPQQGELLPREPRRLGIALTGPRDAGGWWGSDQVPLDFFDLKGIIELLLERLGVTEARFEATQHPAFGPRVARLLINGQVAGVLGELHPAVRSAYDLPSRRVPLAELDLIPLVNAFQQEVRLKPVPAYPAVREDIAVIVDERITAADVAAAIRKAGGRLLWDVALFDVYRGEQIPSDKKSLAFALTYQALDRTLTDKEVAKVRARIVRQLERELGATLRS